MNVNMAIAGLTLLLLLGSGMVVAAELEKAI